MKDVFITSTLKSEWNKSFNPLLCQKLEENNILCHLPQRDTNQDGSYSEKYTQNIDGINNSKRVLSIGINESVNWGLETGYSFGIGKKVILLTDKDHFIPVMSLGMFYKIIKVTNFDDFSSYLDDLIEALTK